MKVTEKEINKDGKKIREEKMEENRSSKVTKTMRLDESGWSPSKNNGKMVKKQSCPCA
jgi:hypothetical protein